MRSSPSIQYPKLVVEVNSILFANFYNPFVTLNFEDIDVMKYYFGSVQLVRLEYEEVFFLIDYEIQLDFEVVVDHNGGANLQIGVKHIITIHDF